MTNDKLKIKNEGVASRHYHNTVPKAHNHLTFVIGHLTLLLITLGLSASAQTSFDPMTLSVGAKAMGMGKAYVAVAEDCETIFSNPAGLGEIDSFRFTSMSATILEDVHYTLLGGVYPLGERSAIGIGYVSAGVNGIEIRDANGFYIRRADYSKNLLIFSYGKKFTDKFSLGLNIKHYSESATALGNGDGWGLNADLGILQKGLGWFSIGAVGQNIINTGKIQYKNGEEGKLPSNIKVGTKLHIMGNEFEAAILSPIKLATVLDANISLQAAEPTSLHWGIEYSPSSYLAFRTGIDQNPKPGGVENNVTYGLSLRVAGLGFHYAYHPYTEFSENTSHYFSISFDERGWPFEGLPDTFLGQTDSSSSI